jgi:hypothetical protein
VERRWTAVGAVSRGAGESSEVCAAGTQLPWFVGHFAELTGQSAAAAAAELWRLLIQDLREGIAIACLGGRCSELVATIDAAAERILATTSVGCESKADRELQWRCGEQCVEMECAEGETDTSCWLSFDLPSPVGNVFFSLHSKENGRMLTLRGLESKGEIDLIDLSPESPASLLIVNRWLGIE